MSSKNSNKLNIPEAKAAMDKFKMEAANEVGVNLKNGYNGDLTSREAGSVGGQMVKKMIESYEKTLKLHRRRRPRPGGGALPFCLSVTLTPIITFHSFTFHVNYPTMWSQQQGNSTY